MGIIIKLIHSIKSLINVLYNNLIFKLKHVKKGTNIVIRGRLKIVGSGTIRLGDNLKINSGANYNIIGGDTRTVFSVAPNAVFTIGNNTGISNATFICKEQITIGNFVKIGGDTKVYDTDFHALDATLRSNAKTDIGQTKPVNIRDHAFIGAGSIVLKGVTVGEQAIVGAGSVVTKSIPEKQIWGGNPAKFIREID